MGGYFQRKISTTTYIYLFFNRLAGVALLFLLIEKLTKKIKPDAELRMYVSAMDYLHCHLVRTHSYDSLRFVHVWYFIYGLTPIAWRASGGVIKFYLSYIYKQYISLFSTNIFPYFSHIFSSIMTTVYYFFWIFHKSNCCSISIFCF